METGVSFASAEAIGRPGRRVMGKGWLGSRLEMDRLIDMIGSC